MSLAAMLSIKSIASLGVFILILPSAEASKSCLDCGLNPSMNMLSCIGSEKPWVGVFRNKPLNLSSVSLNDSSGNWWKDEMAALLFAVFDSRKYFFKNFYTTSSHDFRLFPLKEWSHLLASTDKENEWVKNVKEKTKRKKQKSTQGYFWNIQLLLDAQARLVHKATAIC